MSSEIKSNGSSGSASKTESDSALNSLNPTIKSSSQGSKPQQNNSVSKMSTNNSHNSSTSSGINKNDSSGGNDLKSEIKNEAQNSDSGETSNNATLTENKPASDVKVERPPPRNEPHVEPVNGVVQPRVNPPSSRPGRITNQLLYLKNQVVKGWCLQCGNFRIFCHSDFT